MLVGGGENMEIGDPTLLLTFDRLAVRRRLALEPLVRHDFHSQAI